MFRESRSTTWGMTASDHVTLSLLHRATCAQLLQIDPRIQWQSHPGEACTLLSVLVADANWNRAKDTVGKLRLGSQCDSPGM